MTERTLPQLDEGILDAAALEQLLRDVERCTELLELRLKGEGRERAHDAASPDLQTVRATLSSGACRGAQLRYRYQDAEWWDTIMVVPGGFKLVRIRHDWSTP